MATRLVGWRRASLVVGLGGVLVLWGLVSWGEEWLRGRLETYINAQLSDEVQFSLGDFDVEWAWSPRVVLGSLRLADKHGRPLAQLERLAVSIDPGSVQEAWPRIPALSIQGGSVALARDAQGEWNAAHWLRPQTASDAPLRVPLTLERIQLTDIQLALDDAVQGQQLQFVLDALELGPWRPSQAAMIKAEGRLSLSQIQPQPQPLSPSPPPFQSPRAHLAFTAQAELAVQTAFPNVDWPLSVRDVQLRLQGDLTTESAAQGQLGQAELRIAAVHLADGQGGQLEGLELAPVQMSWSGASSSSWQAQGALTVSTAAWSPTQLTLGSMQTQWQLEQDHTGSAQIEVESAGAEGSTLSATEPVWAWHTQPVRVALTSDSPWPAAQAQLTFSAKGVSAEDGEQWQVEMAPSQLALEQVVWPGAPHRLSWLGRLQGRDERVEAELNARLDDIPMTVRLSHQAERQPPWLVRAQLPTLTLPVSDEGPGAALPPPKQGSEAAGDSLFTILEAALEHISAHIEIGTLRRGDLVLRDAVLKLGVEE